MCTVILLVANIFDISMASKIRSGTTEQSTQQQVQLFRTIKKACGAVSEEVGDESKGAEDRGGQDKCMWFFNVFPFLRQDALANRNDEIAVSAKSASKKMKEVMNVLANTEPSEADSMILDQLVVVNDALDKILAR